MLLMHYLDVRERRRRNEFEKDIDRELLSFHRNLVFTNSEKFSEYRTCRLKILKIKAQRRNGHRKRKTENLFNVGL